jgi:hypothetical protein
MKEATTNQLDPSRNVALTGDVTSLLQPVQRVANINRINDITSGPNFAQAGSPAFVEDVVFDKLVNGPISGRHGWHQRNAPIVPILAPRRAGPKQAD